jgi:hypothetical protein
MAVAKQQPWHKACAPCNRRLISRPKQVGYVRLVHNGRNYANGLGPDSIHLRHTSSILSSSSRVLEYLLELKPSTRNQTNYDPCNVWMMHLMRPYPSTSFLKMYRGLDPL